MKLLSIKHAKPKLVVCLLLLATAGWAVLSPTLPQRMDLVSLKLEGKLPEAPWGDILVGHPPAVELQRDWSLYEKGHGAEPCPVLWGSPMGDFWGREEDLLPLGIVIQEQYSRKVYENGPVAIRPGDVVFDGGSHLGAFTRFALQHGAGLVVAFEPESTNIACYKRTFSKELADKRVILVEAALWEEPGTLDFTTGKHSGAGSVHPAAGNPDAHLVPATTIDETVARLKLDRLDFIKLDIEGSERYALRGGRESLARFNPRMAICIYHKSDDREVVPQVVLAARPEYQMTMTGEVAYFH